MTKKRLISIAFISIILGLSIYLICSNLKLICEFFKQDERHVPSEPIQTPPEEHKETGKDTHHKKERTIKLTPEQIRLFRIETLKITKSNFQSRLTLPGHVALNENTIIHVVPSVSGMVKEIYKGLGEATKAGEPLAILQSRDMAEAKSSYIAAHKDLVLKEDLYGREETLWKKEVKSEIQFLQARNTFENAKVHLEQVNQKLLALGMKEDQIKKLPEQKTPLNIYTIDSPIAGKVIERDISLGEVISEDKQVFVIANLDTVWVELAIPDEDLQKVKKDQKVNLFAHQGETIQSGNIMYVSPVINQESRTGKAIIQIDNLKQAWHPGDFITAQVIINDQSNFLSLPKSVIQQINGQPHVFVKKEDGVFEARPIQINGSDKGEFIEIFSGVQEGEEIVSTNTFLLKAELGKGEAEHSH